MKNKKIIVPCCQKVYVKLHFYEYLNWNRCCYAVIKKPHEWKIEAKSDAHFQLKHNNLVAFVLG